MGELYRVTLATAERVRRWFVEEGLEVALSPYRTPRRRYRRKLDGEQEAQLLMLACSQPPAGRARWTLHLLADTMVEVAYVETLSYETVRQTLKKTLFSQRFFTHILPGYRLSDFL